MSKKGSIILDDKWSIKPDNGSGFNLRFVETRKREKKDGTLEEYEYFDNYYYPNLKYCLEKYVYLSFSATKNLEELIEKTDKIYKILSDI